LDDNILETISNKVVRAELLRYIGLWSLMSSVSVEFKKKDFWSTSLFDERENPCPPNFRKLMPSNHFDAITSALTFTSVNKPTYQDKFWEVCQAILEWSKNMACVFSSGRFYA
jgi:hypothetical protein